MSQRESRLSLKILQALRHQGWFCYKNHADEFTMVGLPDIVVCAEGHFIGLETKLPENRNKVSARQRLVHEMIIHSGGGAYVVTSVREAIARVKEHLAGAGSKGAADQPAPDGS